jgi:MarR family transcriptional regulator, 2-MHQ and catechol-resistance regulon repressor
MSSSVSPKPANASIFPVLRELMQTHQSFLDCVAEHVSQFGLTAEQFDVVATLGNTQGMTLVQLDTKTLLTNLELDRVLDELEADQLIVRTKPQGQTILLVKLTPLGEKIFGIVFPLHIQFLQERFGKLDQAEIDMLLVFLRRLNHSFYDENDQFVVLN